MVFGAVLVIVANGVDLDSLIMAAYLVLAPAVLVGGASVMREADSPE